MVFSYTSQGHAHAMSKQNILYICYSTQETTKTMYKCMKIFDSVVWFLGNIRLLGIFSVRNKRLKYSF